ncbi:Uncharacterized protein dnm_075260 [Desulfonema magnum]|uniref:Uncharacterized protein n=1 Tax=Desulfonema magnum TaxID=45655 RepID=A0A975BTG1_9BACT|nr:Uncharacterized protein dnm_075260 [Desulfonema magnum]
MSLKETRLLRAKKAGFYGQGERLIRGKKPGFSPCIWNLSFEN